MSYFRTGVCTIIGAEAFHGPVRNGKGWDHLAIFVRRSLGDPGMRPDPGMEEVEAANTSCVLRTHVPRGRS